MTLEFGVAIFAVILTAVVWTILDCSYRYVRSISWPQLSDDEFMARMPKGTNREIAMNVRTIVAKQAGICREAVHPDTKFIDL